ncbi:MAG: hypothetical protein AB7O59_18140 [Pirellulales bacterium]
MLLSQPHAASVVASRVLPARIEVRCSEPQAYAREIVRTALIRSFTAAQVAPGSSHADADCVVWIQPEEAAADDVGRLLATGGKAVVLGAIGPRVAAVLGLEWRGPIDWPGHWGCCQASMETHHDESPVVIVYDEQHSLGVASPLRRRPLCRFDFAEEWNNLGFGRITLSGDAWSLATAVAAGDARPIATIAPPSGKPLVYVAVRDTERGSALWFNRAVGPVDSLEWCVVESFLGDYRAAELPCLPYLGEVPLGYRGALCARLDCDEAMASARPLVELYRARGVPLSLAVLTGLSLDEADLHLMREVLAAGGSVVPHSEHHFANWGGSYECARAEADESRAWFESHLPEAGKVRYAVSPFHQNPPFAVAALADTGYDGFIGGIIANDPEYLLGRAGRVPFAPRPLVSHSAQCMLHGDCYRRYGNRVDTYCQAFDEHVAGRAIFGCLDHPFSARYQYGWDDETTRVAAHARLLDHIAIQSDIWHCGLNDALDFLCRRDQVQAAVDSAGQLAIDASAAPAGPPVAIHWKGRTFGA